MNGISALIKEAADRSFIPLPREDTARGATVNQEEGPTRMQPCCHLDLTLPASRTMRNNVCCL